MSDWIKPGIPARCDLLRNGEPTGTTVLVRLGQVQRSESGEIVSVVVTSMTALVKSAVVLPQYLHPIGAARAHPEPGRVTAPGNRLHPKRRRRA